MLKKSTALALVSLISLIGLSMGANAAIIEITENFDNNSYDTNNFVFNQTSQGGGTLNTSGGAAFISNRGAFSTVSNNFIGTETNPLFISATMNMFSQDIAFLSFRGDGQPNAFYNNEPNIGITLRMHNFINGQTDVMYNTTGNAASGLEWQSVARNPPGGASFYSGPVQIEIEDFGSYATFSLTNMSNSQNFSFTQTGLENSARDGHVAFSGNNVSWDNIVIRQDIVAAEVSEPAMASMLALTLGALAWRRRKSTEQV